MQIFEAGTNRELCGSPVLAMLHPGQPFPRKCEVKVLSKSAAITKKGAFVHNLTHICIPRQCYFVGFEESRHFEVQSSVV